MKNWNLNWCLFLTAKIDFFVRSTTRRLYSFVYPQVPKPCKFTHFWHLFLCVFTHFWHLINCFYLKNLGYNPPQKKSSYRQNFCCKCNYARKIIGRKREILQLENIAKLIGKAH